MKVNCDSEGIGQASNVIKEGGTVVFPTDTVYGIGCDPFNKNSVDKIYQIKQRDKNKPFPVLTYSADFASEIVEFDEVSKKAEKRGARVTGSEIVGLIPLKPMLDAGKYFLKKQNRSTLRAT